MPCLFVAFASRAIKLFCTFAPKKNKTNERIDSYFKEMEIGLHEALGRKVKVEYGKNKGALILEFYDRDDLSELAKRLTKE